jgi:hypothetical protein
MSCPCFTQSTITLHEAHATLIQKPDVTGDPAVTSDFLRSYSSLRRNYPTFKEPCCSLQTSEEAPTGPNLETGDCRPYSHIPFPQDPFYYYTPTYVFVSQVVTSLQIKV